MAVSHALADAFNAYRSGPFGFKPIDMNARFATNDTTFVESGTRYTPPISSRNVEQWRMVDTDDEYTYDSNVMNFPLPRHHLNYGLIEVEFQFEGLFANPSTNVWATARLEMCEKQDGEWVSIDAREYNFGIIPAASGNPYHRIQGFVKTFINYTQGYDPKQYMIRPMIIYSYGQFRIQRAYGRVYLHQNPVAV